MKELKLAFLVIIIVLSRLSPANYAELTPLRKYVRNGRRFLIILSELTLFQSFF